MISIKTNGFKILHTAYDETGSFITWYYGTGDNVELHRLLVTKFRQGIGRSLFRSMLIDLRRCPPYETVYGFTRMSNVAAHRFYIAMGFELTPVQGIYRDGMAILFSARYDTLCNLHQIPYN